MSSEQRRVVSRLASYGFDVNAEVLYALETLPTIKKTKARRD